MALILSPRQLTQRSHFYQQLGQLLAAGLTVVQALQLIQRNPPNRSFVKPLQTVLHELEGGSTVTEALRHPIHWLPAFDLALLSAGEHSGRLDAVAKMLATYYEERVALLNRTISGMLYPVFVLHLAIFIFALLPMFTGGTLTGFLLRTVGVVVPMYLLVFGMIYAGQGSHGADWRSRREKLLRRVPVLGRALQALALARLAAALEALTAAGVTIIEAWDMASAACGSAAIQRAVAAWKPAVVAGQPPAEAVRACTLIPEMFANLYATGEASGQLDESLKRLHRYYQEESSFKLGLLARWVPMGVYLCVAGYVGYLVVSWWANYAHEIDNASHF